MAVQEIDYNNMSDDDVEAILQQIDSGTFNSGNDEDENQNTEDGSTQNTSTPGSDDDLGNNENTNTEDTDGSDEEPEETDTEYQDDDSDTATGSEGNEDESANTQENNQDTNKGTNADTNTSEDASGVETGKIDPAEYERLKKFYDQIANAEFVANGKKVKGFTDPEKIIRSQQMLHGYSDRMKGFNEYRPFMKALKENGLLEDESKFNLALSLIKGDKAAIKQHMKTLNIDPVDLELDETEYKPKNYVLSREALILEDTLQVAKESGIEDKLRKTIGEQWDNESFNEFVNNAEVRKDLMEHMQSGAFDLVQDKIREMEVLDTFGTFRNMKSTDKYRQAVVLVNKELAARRPAEPVVNQYIEQKNRFDAIKKQNESAELAKKEAEYKAQVERKNREADEARKKAAAISKKKVTTTQTKKFDPLALDGDELNSFVDGLISGNIK